jgi:hypothetical protein
MTLTETSLIAGSAAQTIGERWGDYSALSVDPADDCTFWYTNEYIPANGLWQTRIGAFRLGSCNRRPVLDQLETTQLIFPTGGPERVVTQTITVTDLDNTELAGARVAITGNYQRGEDFLGFQPQNGITGSFNVADGSLTLNGVASLADYQAALRSVTYANSSANPITQIRSVSFTVSDGGDESLPLSRSIRIVPDEVFSDQFEG